MDSRRFDHLARTLATPADRRVTLAALLSAGLAGVLPIASDAEPRPAACLAVGKRCSQPASGAAHGKGKRKGKGKPPSCSKCCSRFGTAGPNGKARCTCKGEGVSCDNDSQCCGGRCTSSGCTGCPGDTVFCSDGCADLATNNQHCGSCDNACAAGQRCVNRQCVYDGTSCPTGCCDGTGQCKRGTSASACGDNGATCAVCPTAAVCCDGACRNGTACCATAAECGSCETCQAGACVPNAALQHACGGPCPAGQWCDAGACADIQATVTIIDCGSRCDTDITLCGQSVTCPACIQCYEQTGCPPNTLPDGPDGPGNYCAVADASGSHCSSNSDCSPGRYCASSANYFCATICPF